jgi:Family of unknown function (DUF5677)
MLTGHNRWPGQYPLITLDGLLMTPWRGGPTLRSVSAGDDERQSRILTPELLLVWQKGLAAGVSNDTLNEIWNGALDKSAVGLADRLRADGPRMLAEHAELREGFEWRLQKRWRSALDLYEMVLVACTEAGSDLHDALMQEVGTVSDHPIKLHALTLLHARACMVASEAFALLRTGHAAGAQARWRTLHEIAVIAFTLGASGEDLANRFLLHRQVERWKEAQCYQENCAALRRERFSDKEMDEFRADYDAAVGQYEEGYERDWGWSKPRFPSPRHRPNFDDLEKLAGLGQNKPFVKLSHHAIHGGASGALDVFELYGRGEVMLAGPSNAGLAEPGHGSLIALYQVTVAYLLNGPNQTNPEELRTLKGIALLLDEGGIAFGACDVELTGDEGVAGSR